MSKTVNVSFPWVGILGVMFVGLKLTKQIDWDWWLVLAPFWAPLAVILPILFLVVVLQVLVARRR